MAVEASRRKPRLESWSKHHGDVRLSRIPRCQVKMSRCRTLVQLRTETSSWLLPQLLPWLSWIKSSSAGNKHGYLSGSLGYPVLNSSAAIFFTYRWFRGTTWCHRWQTHSPVEVPAAHPYHGLCMSLLHSLCLPLTRVTHHICHEACHDIGG